MKLTKGPMQMRRYADTRHPGMFRSWRDVLILTATSVGLMLLFGFALYAAFH